MTNYEEGNTDIHQGLCVFPPLAAQSFCEVLSCCVSSLPQWQELCECHGATGGFIKFAPDDHVDRIFAVIVLPLKWPKLLTLHKSITYYCMKIYQHTQQKTKSSRSSIVFLASQLGCRHMSTTRLHRKVLSIRLDAMFGGFSVGRLSILNAVMCWHYLWWNACERHSKLANYKSGDLCMIAQVVWLATESYFWKPWICQGRNTCML